MRSVLRQVLAAAFIAAGALLPVHSPGALSGPWVAGMSAAEHTVDLQGTWVLNKDLGADPIGELNTSRPKRPTGAGGMAAPGSGGGLGGPLIGGRRRLDRANAEEMARVKEMLRQIMAAPERMTIAVEGPVIEVSGDDGSVHRLHADGKKLRDRSYTGLEFDRKTKWDGDVLVTEFALTDSEAKAKQTWARTGTRLRIVTKLMPPNGADPLEVRRGYDLESATK